MLGPDDLAFAPAPLAAFARGFAPPPFGGAAAPAAGAAPSDALVARWLAGGKAVLAEAARATRLDAALKAGRLTAAQGRALLGRIVADGRALLTALTGGLVAGGMRLGAWFGAMRAAVAPRHAAGAMALLDDPAPPPADVQAIVAAVQRQLGFLARFRDQIATAAVLLGPGTVARAGLYARAIWGTAVNVLTGRMKRDGFTQARRILGPSDHCGDCLTYASQGWMPVDEVPVIGDSRCQSLCACHIIYR